MKNKFISVILTLALLAAAVLSGCGKNKPQEPESTVEADSETEESADVESREDPLEITSDDIDEQLAWCKEAGYVVFENGIPTAGTDNWAAFLEKVDAKKNAIVYLAYYYTGEGVTEELAAEYPQLFFGQMVKNQDGFRIMLFSYREGKIDLDKRFKFMIHFKGELREGAAHQFYEFYTLTMKDGITYDQIVASMLDSSRDDAAIVHYNVYTNYYDEEPVPNEEESL